MTTRKMQDAELLRLRLALEKSQHYARGLESAVEYWRRKCLSHGLPVSPDAILRDIADGLPCPLCAGRPSGTFLRCGACGRSENECP